MKQNKLETYRARWSPCEAKGPSKRERLRFAQLLFTVATRSPLLPKLPPRGNSSRTGLTRFCSACTNKHLAYPISESPSILRISLVLLCRKNSLLVSLVQFLLESSQSRGPRPSCPAAAAAAAAAGAPSGRAVFGRGHPYSRRRRGRLVCIRVRARSGSRGRRGRRHRYRRTRAVRRTLRAGPSMAVRHRPQHTAGGGGGDREDHEEHLSSNRSAK